MDGGEADGVAALRAPDVVYDIDEPFLAGRERIRAGWCARPHTGAGSGRAVPMSWGRRTSRPPGAKPWAVRHSLMVVHEEGRYIVRRATANHWRLRRKESGRQVVTRTNRTLNGRPDSPGLPVRGVRGKPTGS